MEPKYDHTKIKDLIIERPTLPPEPDPAWTHPGIHLRSTETDAAAIEDKAIRVAETTMDSLDPNLALSAAKAAMSWLGKGTKARTTIFANNAQVNQLTEDPDKSSHILSSLKDSINLLTQGQKIEETL